MPSRVACSIIIPSMSGGTSDVASSSTAYCEVAIAVSPRPLSPHQQLAVLAVTTHLRLVVEEPRPRDLLLVPTAQCLAPLPRSVPATFTLDYMLHLHDRKNIEQVTVSDAACTYASLSVFHPGEIGEAERRTSIHVLDAVRVDDLVPERPEGEIGPLRDEDELVRGRLAHDTAVHRPETTEDPEQRGLAASIGADDKQVLLDIPCTPSQHSRRCDRMKRVSPDSHSPRA